MLVNTSLDAFASIQKELRPRQAQVLKSITNYPNHTNSELSKILHLPLQSVTPRTGELNDMGLIKRVERRACAVTGGNSWTWVSV